MLSNSALLLFFFSVNEVTGSELCSCFPVSLRSTENLVLLHTLFFFFFPLWACCLKEKEEAVQVDQIEARIRMVMFLASC